MTRPFVESSRTPQDELTMRQLIERTIERVDDGSSRMLIRGNLAAMLKRLDEAPTAIDAYEDEQPDYRVVHDPEASRSRTHDKENPA